MDKIRNRQTPLNSALSGIGMLIVGIGLLVIGGMNLFTNILQIQQGMWQKNILLSSILMIVFSIVPALLGAMLVFRSTAIPSSKKIS
jgi:uncharacterized membrane protein YidH (DUF202 family)